VTGALRRRALIACLCLAAQSFALAHLFLVVHSKCAEHGEVVHGQHHEADASGLTHLVSSDGDLAATDDHDHCQTFAEPRDHRIAPPVLGIDVLAPIAAACASETATVVTPRALYRLAPKASPPHAA
jgi:hypothetical protein